MGILVDMSGDTYVKISRKLDDRCSNADWDDNDVSYGIIHKSWTGTAHRRGLTG